MAWMLAPAAACLIMALALGWFGFHVLQREVIFVDLALAQMAALGATWAVFLGHDPSSLMAYMCGGVFTVVGAVAFSLTRHFEKRVPQEAIIGIAYAVAAAGAVLMIEFAADAHGAEKLQHLLVGNIVWVSWQEMIVLALGVGAVGLLQIWGARSLLQISLNPKEAAQSGKNLVFWDLFFYLSFGAIITLLVPIAGVLMVFSFLVIPAVIGKLFADGPSARLKIAYAVALPLSLFGVSISYNHSAGPIIVVLLGLALLLSLLVDAARRAEHPGRFLSRVLMAAALIGIVFWSLAQVSPTGQHAHSESAEAGHTAANSHAHKHGKDEETAHQDPLSDVESALSLVQAGDAQGLVLLAELTKHDLPFYRIEAVTHLQVLAGESGPLFDPHTGPDTQGLWSAWASNPPVAWRERIQALESW